jgi:hypothetical protein
MTTHNKGEEDFIIVSHNGIAYALCSRFSSELQEFLLAAFVVMLIFIRQATSLEASSKELAIMKNA